jgi:hypothetical protein
MVKARARALPGRKVFDTGVHATLEVEIFVGSDWGRPYN